MIHINANQGITSSDPTAAEAMKYRMLVTLENTSRSHWQPSTAGFLIYDESYRHQDGKMVSGG